MNYTLENINLLDQYINLALPKDFNSNEKYSLYLVFDGSDLLENPEMNILIKNNSNKIFVGLNNPNNVVRFNNLSTYSNQTVKQLMDIKYPELNDTSRDSLGGDGQKIINFIKNDLLSFLKDTKKIQISDLNLLGCSMGAYFSLQLLYLSDLVFKKSYLFSPSIWFNEKIVDDLKVSTINKNMPLTINLWVGLKEPTKFERTIPTDYPKEAETLKKILEEHQEIKVNFFAEKDGSHGFKWWINFMINHPELW